MLKNNKHETRKANLMQLRPLCYRWSDYGQRILVFAAILIEALVKCSAGDWPQYRGPNHDGISTEAIRTNWKEEPPKEIWRVPLGSAWSSLTVSGGKVFTLVSRLNKNNMREYCVALDAKTGVELWAACVDPYAFPDDSFFHGGDPNSLGDVGNMSDVIEFIGGPRSTPSVDGDRVFVMSSFLRLVCLDSSSGRYCGVMIS